MIWLKWAVGEATSRIFIATILKVIGELVTVFSQLLISTLIIGATQTAVSGSVLLVKKKTAFLNARHVLGSVIFGVGAFLGAILPLVAFKLGADLGTYVFLTLLSIVPGAVIDNIFFKMRLLLRQMVGIAVALLAGWLILNTPSLQELINLPLWIHLALANAVIIASNQGVTCWIKEVDVWVKNFWGGTVTLLFSFFVLMFLYNTDITSFVTVNLEQLLGWSLILGVAVITLWSFNVLAYRYGASISTKNVVTNGIYLAGSMIIGYLVFGESIRSIQIVGIALYIVAFILLNRES